MSILRYFKISGNNAGLPDSNAIADANEKVIVEVANSSVNKALELQKERKRGAYTAYSSSTRAKIGKFAAENGNKAAVAKFTKELGKPVNESTVRSLKTCYLNALKSTGNESVSTLEHGNRGRPLNRS